MKLSARILGLVLAAIGFCSPADAKFVVAWSAVSALNSPFWVMQEPDSSKKKDWMWSWFTSAGAGEQDGFRSAHVATDGFLAQKPGTRMIANLAKEDIPFMHIALTTSGKWIRENRSKQGVCPGYGRAVHFMHNHKDETRNIFARYTKINDPGMLDGSIQYGYDFMEKIPLVKSQAFQVTLDQIARNNHKAKQVKPDQFFDNSSVQEVVDEGFFAKLWGKKL